MIRGIYTNAGAMLSNQMKMEVTANNIANANSTGFKKDGVFRKYLVDHATIIRQHDSDYKNLEDVDEIWTDFSQGNLVSTGNPLDAAIEGSGFFTVMTPDGERYTRNGNFTVDENGILRTTNGYQVEGINGPILIQGQQVMIGDDGSVSVDGNIVDTLRIVDFSQPYRMNKLGDGLFAAAPGTAQAASPDQFTIRQAMLEEANVEVVKEMTEVIQATRDFEANQRSISMQDETLDKVINDVGRVR